MGENTVKALLRRLLNVLPRGEVESFPSGAQGFETAPLQDTPARFAPETWTNSIGMAFVKIPAGSYMRGCKDGEDDYDDEKPQRRISISSFWMGVHEVTQAQWEAVMGSNPSDFKGRDHPVENVNWLEAQEFVRRLNAKEGHERYRLPTEAEWEYAARAGSTTKYCFGDDERDLGDYAWYGSNSGCVTHPVGQKQPNAWGLYDMHGNVWEWVQDWFRGNYYATSDTDNPRGPDTGGYRALRGGSCCQDPRYCRSATRYFAFPDQRDEDIGLRLALSQER